MSGARRSGLVGCVRADGAAETASNLRAVDLPTGRPEPPQNRHRRLTLSVNPAKAGVHASARSGDCEMAAWWLPEQVRHDDWLRRELAPGRIMKGCGRRSGFYRDVAQPEPLFRNADSARICRRQMAGSFRRSFTAVKTVHRRTWLLTRSARRPAIWPCGSSATISRWPRWAPTSAWSSTGAGSSPGRTPRSSG